MKTLNLSAIRIFFFLSSFLAPVLAFCQISTMQRNGKLEIYDRGQLIDTLHPLPGQMYEVHRILRVDQLIKDHFYYQFPYASNLGTRFDNKATKSEVYEGLGWGISNLYKSIIIDGDCDIELAAQEINENNATNYRYRIIQNGSRELIPWTTPNVFKYTTDKRFKYAYLGRIPYRQGQVIKVEIYNVKNIRNQDAMMIDWRPVEPARVKGYVQYLTARMRLPDNGLVSGYLDQVKHPHVTSRIFKFNGKEYPATPYPIPNFVETDSLNDIKIRLGDSIQNILFDITNDKRLYNYRVIFRREVDGNKDSIDFLETNDKLILYKEFWKKPGKYSITFTPKIHKHGGTPIRLLHNLATTVSFTILPDLHEEHRVSVKTVLYIILIILTTGGFMFVMYRSGQKRKLAAEAKHTQITTLQLQSIRSQLNPHFMFNALAGIQNLMNKNETELANKYLARFARITRNVLDNGNKELVSIEQETDLLADYLQMEQLRFGFRYNIFVDDKNIDQQIEIPAMLLQPFVENAVKHGISSLKDKGLIDVEITRNNEDLLLSVTDNGNGFTKVTGNGMGIRLCEERIKLLNSIYKKSVISLKINSADSGTVVTILLKNWI